MTPKLDADNTRLYFLAKEFSEKLKDFPRDEAEKAIDFLRLFVSFNDFTRKMGVERPSITSDAAESLVALFAVVLSMPITNAEASARAFINVEIGSGQSATH